MLPVDFFLIINSCVIYFLSVLWFQIVSCQLAATVLTLSLMALLKLNITAKMRLTSSLANITLTVLAIFFLMALFMISSNLTNLI